MALAHKHRISVGLGNMYKSGSRRAASVSLTQVVDALDNATEE